MIDNNQIYIKYTENPKQEDTAFLTNSLSKIATQKKDMPPIRDYAFFIMQNDQIMGGICGCIYYGCLYIDELWIDTSLRGVGYGTQLIDKVTSLAIDEQCLFCTVNTMDWEAKDFYLKLGFKLEFVRQGYLQNSSMYMLRKNLVNSTSHHVI